MNKERWSKINYPVPVSKEYPCELGDVVSHYGGFHAKLVLEVDPNGLPVTMLTMKGDDIPVDQAIADADDGTLYHTDRTATEEEWRHMHPYAQWKSSDAMRLRIWAHIFRSSLQ